MEMDAMDKHMQSKSGGGARGGFSSAEVNEYSEATVVYGQDLIDCLDGIIIIAILVMGSGAYRPLVQPPSSSGD